jgi:hypothetical protein
MGAAMTPALQNPDRNFSADGKTEDVDGLRRALAEDEPPIPFNETAKRRIGKAIADAILPRFLRHAARGLNTKRTSRFG